MELKFELNANKLTVYLPERIDTVNSKDVEDAILDVIDANPDFEELELNAASLLYISSVGLRVVLRLKKAHNALSVVEAANDVYEVFEMTGFTEMITVKKRMREISIEGCPMIGEGYYGRVYRISPDTIVKHYYRGTPIPEIDRERQVAKIAFVSGVPTAIAYDVVRIKEGGYGAVYELIEAKSLKNAIVDDLANFDKYVDAYADVIKRIAMPANDAPLPTCADLAKQWLERDKPYLKPEVYAKTEKLVNGIADEGVLVHGDCHFKNIFVLPDGEPVLIDMDSVMKGSRIFDYASIYIAYIAYELEDPGNLLKFMGVPAEICQKLYYGVIRKIYEDRSEAEYQLILKKIAFLANVHFLSKSILEEEDKFGRIPKTVQRIEEAVDGLTDLSV
ncbi:MAG: phosphotransferase [Bacilli bacterium]|nr:phosphotransferase [Bacilli bacterium]